MTPARTVPLPPKSCCESTSTVHFWRPATNVTAFATACNPRSRTDLPAEENVRRQAVLIAELDRRGLRWMPGESRDADGLWRESSVLVLGLSRRDTLLLAEQAEQYAVVHAGDDAVPRLLACAAMAKAELS